MSSYLSSLLTHTTSRYTSLRRTLLNNEDDGPTEDDSHISRVLRAYYTEKGQPFPPWLPADPNDRRAIQNQTPAIQSGYGKNSYGAVQAQSQAGNRGSLSELWDTPAASAAPAQPLSLRAGRRVGGPAGARPEPPTSGGLAPRPLPSQREGSYQSVRSNASGRSGYDSGEGTSAGGGTAQERLKARLWGGARGGGAAGAGAGAGQYGQSGEGREQEYGSGRPGDGRRYGRIT
ncbi:hypothetical protein B0A48_15305 [Cryoendolithus antarcticus]|uniref:Mso1 N-terminal domain-containing protein n=1 Tax=Cryoendolithus antarcticus TaxID=1507870 RepID=A0A1V8SHT6_9PEZI|nr:hypothetical protein B0A48_15305 [Cryoendolithus antarcticus]